MKKAKGFGKPTQHELQQALDQAARQSREGNLTQARDSYLKVLQTHPDQPTALHLLGIIYQQLGDLNQGVQLIARAAALQPKDAQLHYNLGVALNTRGSLDEAAVSFQKAIDHQPDSAEAHNSLAGVLQLQGKLSEANHHYQQAIALKPRWTIPHDNYLLNLQYQTDLDPQQWQIALANFQRACADLPRLKLNPSVPHKRLRVGYVSPDFYQHACAWFLLPLFTHYDRAEFEFFAYAQVKKPDGMTARLRSLVDHWQSTVGLSDDQMAALIQQDDIDILVDLAGHTAWNRLPVFARKPAPVQVTWLGFPGSTGLQEMDYRLSDPWLTPPGTPEYSSEQVWNLPRPAHCYALPSDAPPVGPLPCLTKGYITFGSFNNLIKATPATLILWAKVLQAVPDSRLLLKSWQLANPGIRQRLLIELEERGVAPQRVVFLGHQPTTAAHLGCYQQVDIALDTFPYHGTTTTFEALSSGVPVVTLVGERTAARVGLSLMQALALPVARTPEEYVQCAVSLAQDRAGLAHLRVELRGRLLNSPLGDGVDFAQAVSGAFRRMWDR
ncbi:tetratricopeptide repeat protein [Candidatus Cyanaurora vandensis]|uniref:O-linked N-acetylglucosamine transferase, SPINDLY family protein n=1 Tax=Candidatus Cyanaurora vandensis TaxID=2714958 RepID=UPI00257BE794|nr:tetratricopeptide repeat protein [Candidatus Cyanaurora vandensis]